MNKLITRFPRSLALLIGSVSATGFAPWGLWLLAILMVGLWMVIVGQAKSGRSAFAIGWFFGLGHFTVSMNWIAKSFTFQSAMPEFLGYVAVILLSLYLAIFPGIASLAAWRWWRGQSLAYVLAFAGTWTVAEWLRSILFSGFSWNPIGVIFANLPALRWLAPWIGSYGLSALVLLLSGLVYILLMKWQLVPDGESGDGRPQAVAGPLQRPLTWHDATPTLLIAGILFFAGIFMPRIGQLPNDQPQPAITVVQPNIGQQDKWMAGFEQQNFAKLAGLTQRTDDQPHIIFWPEASIPDYLESGYPQRYYAGKPPQFARNQLAALMKPGDILLLGALKLDFDQAGKNLTGARNAVIAMNQQGEIVGSYDKSHLLPFGEYLPARPFLSALGLSRLAPGDIDFVPGDGPATLDLGTFGKAAVQICYEVIFPGRIVDRANRPDYIFNPSNDAWFGSWGPPQHLGQAQLRAAEEGLPIIRSTPTGISAVIDADGNIVGSVPLGEAGRIDSSLPYPKAPTLFARYGNILPLSFALILLLSAIAIRRRHR